MGQREAGERAGGRGLRGRHGGTGAAVPSAGRPGGWNMTNAVKKIDGMLLTNCMSYYLNECFSIAVHVLLKVWVIKAGNLISSNHGLFLKLVFPEKDSLGC